MLDNGLNKISQIIFLLFGIFNFAYGISAIITRTCTLLKGEETTDLEEVVLRGDEARNAGIFLIILGITFFALSYFQCGYFYEYNTLEYNKCSIFENLEVYKIISVILFLMAILYLIITVKDEES